MTLVKLFFDLFHTHTNLSDFSTLLFLKPVSDLSLFLFPLPLPGGHPEGHDRAVVLRLRQGRLDAGGGGRGRRHHAAQPLPPLRARQEQADRQVRPEEGENRAIKRFRDLHTYSQKNP